jgi:hypothetical protein
MAEQKDVARAEQPMSKESQSNEAPKNEANQANDNPGAEAGLEENYDLVDETAGTNVFLADIGTSLTSHGDGESTLPPQMVEAREREAEFNEDPDRENREIARSLGRDV